MKKINIIALNKEGKKVEFINRINETLNSATKYIETIKTKWT